MSKKIRTEAVDYLFQGILSLKDKEECYTFFEDVCTVNELQSIAQRFEVAAMLRQKNTYLEIAQKTGASTATISRVNRSLNFGSDGYEMVFERLPRLKERRKQLAGTLSGGEQQRVSIARALAKNPKILLCDEPTGALDYKTSKEILKLIEDVNQKYGNTVIMVTHNDAIRNMADRVVKLRDGQIRKDYLNETKIPAKDLEW